ncbi:MAG: hypothetical protein ACK5O6_00680, partial [Betaproteobacteria bacterium]
RLMCGKQVVGGGHDSNIRCSNFAHNQFVVRCLGSKSVRQVGTGDPAAGGVGVFRGGYMRQIPGAERSASLANVVRNARDCGVWCGMSTHAITPNQLEWLTMETSEIVENLQISVKLIVVASWVSPVQTQDGSRSNKEPAVISC